MGRGILNVGGQSTIKMGWVHMKGSFYDTNVVACRAEYLVQLFGCLCYVAGCWNVGYK